MPGLLEAGGGGLADEDDDVVRVRESDDGLGGKDGGD